MMGCPRGGSSEPLGEYSGLAGQRAGGPVLHPQPFLLVCVCGLTRNRWEVVRPSHRTSPCLSGWVGLSLAGALFQVGRGLGY